MAAPSASDLKNSFRANIDLLSSLVTRKPVTYTQQWASTINDAFSTYTNTRTINLVQTWNIALIECDWPFPAYANLEEQIKSSVREFGCLCEGQYFKHYLCQIFYGISLGSITLASGQSKEAKQQRFNDFWLCRNFSKNKADIFSYFYSHPLLTDKRELIGDIKGHIDMGYGLLVYQPHFLFSTPFLEIILKLIAFVFPSQDYARRFKKLT